MSVNDVDRAFEFYAAVFGMVAVFRNDDFLQAQTPGARDVLVFERSNKSSLGTGGVQHFGFRLTSAADIDHAAAEVEEAGGTIVEKGEFCPGEPYLFARDRDGYLVEIWYEIATAVDPD